MLDHIALYVQDLEGARLFFERYWGAKSGPIYHNPSTGFRSYFLSFQGETRLELMHRPGLADGGVDPLSTGYHHVAFRLGSREQVDALTEQLRQDGYRVVSGPRVTGDGYYESCVVGVENLTVELTV